MAELLDVVELLSIVVVVEVLTVDVVELFACYR